MCIFDEGVFSPYYKKGRREIRNHTFSSEREQIFQPVFLKKKGGSNAPIDDGKKNRALMISVQGGAKKRCRENDVILARGGKREMLP